MSKGDQPAFPFVYVDHTDTIYSGITQREYFAVMAMQGMLGQKDIHLRSMQQIASDAVEISEYLLKELKNKSENE